MPTTDPKPIWLACERFLPGGGSPRERTPRRILEKLLEATPPEWEVDNYGTGELVNGFEREVAELLGKEAAVFMPSGIMAQQIALRIWADRRGTKNVAFHPKCHLEIHEQKAYQMLHDLHGILVGNPNRLMTLEELQQVAEPLAAVLLELPQREIGGALPTWEELVAMTSWCRQRGIPLHMDGARLWESQPFYGRSYAQIAGLFDTVYVSFYKSLQGISGAMLTGPADFIREARVWQKRHGGVIYGLWPYALAARQGFLEKVPRMAEFCQKAQEIAQALSTLDGIEITPNPPQTNMMHLFIRGERERLMEASLQVAQAHKTVLFYWLGQADVPGYCRTELTLLEPALELSGDEVRGMFEEVLRLSN